MADRHSENTFRRGSRVLLKFHSLRSEETQVAGTSNASCQSLKQRKNSPKPKWLAEEVMVWESGPLQGSAAETSPKRVSRVFSGSPYIFLFSVPSKQGWLTAQKLSSSNA
jgi:hypothetical protein